MRKYKVMYEVVSNKGNHTLVDMQVISKEKNYFALKKAIEKWLSENHHKVEYVICDDWWYRGYSNIAQHWNTYYIPKNAKRIECENIEWYITKDTILNMFYYDENDNMVNGFKD